MSSTDPASGSSTLPTLYSQTLSSLLPVHNDSISLSTESSQTILSEAQSQLNLIARMLNTIGVFSENEGIEELGDGEMVFMTPDWVRAEVEARLKTEGIRGRVKALEEARNSYKSFLSLLQTYSFPFPDQLKALSSDDTVDLDSLLRTIVPRDPTQKREAKISQYRAEKEMRAKVENGLGTSLSSSPLPAIISLLSATHSSDTTSTSVNPGVHDNLRSLTISLLQYLCTLTASSLASIAQELELLQGVLGQAHIEEEVHVERERQRDDERDRQEGGKRNKEDEMWKLDSPLRGLGGGPKAHLIDERGKPTQPFTILPSAGLQNLSDRARMQAEVFRSSHRLPTMTIDEYLEEEQRRGNIITGGGPEQDAQLTASELLALEAENDGTMEAEEKSEQKRQKEEKWAQYTDLNRKGEGNTMNRG